MCTVSVSTALQRSAECPVSCLVSRVGCFVPVCDMRCWALMLLCAAGAARGAAAAAAARFTAGGDGGDTHIAPTSLSVLVLPVPVIVQAPAQCANNEPPAAARADQQYYNLPSPYILTPTNTQLHNQVFDSHERGSTNYAVPSYDPVPATQTSASPVPVAAPASPAPPAPTAFEEVLYDAFPTAPPQPREPPRRPFTDVPDFPPIEDSRLLLEQFRAEVTDPSLPPIAIDPVGPVGDGDYTFAELIEAGVLPPQSPVGYPAASGRRVECRRCRQPDGPAAPPDTPPPPRFERSLFLRARLQVPRADYVETYSMWWDAASGAARVDFHDGAASAYRMVKQDGRVQSVLIRQDRTGEENVRSCAVSAPRRASLAERALPALPDLNAFSFDGYVHHGAQRAERWQHTLAGGGGELGGARGEALTFRHELVLSRDNHTTTPHWYSVRVDSSMLGADVDGYVHYFDEVQARSHDSTMFTLNIADACEQIDITNQMESVEPLREFTMLRRDPRYDMEIEQYKQKYGRTYIDDLEEAVRKNILIQRTRHAESSNRQGASFESGVGFTSDRLRRELRVLLGVRPDAAAAPGERFPHERAELDFTRERLPRRFDWRQRGAVTRVRNQLPDCMSCWAFATVGAVEGALFVSTGRLVELSEQALVDCAGPFGGHGCSGTWPSAAYDYIKARGLPALDEYSYEAKVLQCREESVAPVTRISGHYNVTPDYIPALKMAIRKYGPTVVIIDSDLLSFYQYKSGYYHDDNCKRDAAQHAVLAVGWTVRRGETYFILKNSWGARWGEAGYMRLRASTNTCGVLRRPSVPRLRAADVLRVPSAARLAASDT